ncbi:Uncharacterised protein [Mycobacteroides abscessus subsp. abscessus]|nr:Uncharacterised protein [Mycobacteroides abscessus subsp. abscessus]
MPPDGHTQSSLRPGPRWKINDGSSSLWMPKGVHSTSAIKV